MPIPPIHENILFSRRVGRRLTFISPREIHNCICFHVFPERYGCVEFHRSAGMIRLGRFSLIRRKDVFSL